MRVYAKNSKFNIRVWPLCALLALIMTVFIPASESEAALLNASPNTSGLWYFDEGAGTVAIDSSGNGNHGVINGATWISPGYDNSALDLDGLDDLVQIADSPSLETGPALTVEAWIRPDALKGCASVINKRTFDNIGGYTLEFDCYGPSRPQFHVYVNGRYYIAHGQLGTISPGGWYHLVGTFDGSAVRLYVNGTQVAQTAASGTITDPVGANTEIGRNIANPYWNGSEAFFNGMIDEVQILNVAIPDSQVMSNYLIGASKYYGNGLIEGKEECDDGNAVGGDGCSGTCVVEQGYSCTGSPSTCTLTACSPPASGEISSWTGDGGAQDVVGSNDGTLQGGATTSTGLVNMAFDLDGIDDFVRIPDSPTLGLSQITVEAWIKPDVLKGCVSVVNERTPDNIGAFILEFNCYDGSQPIFYVYVNGSYYWVIAPTGSVRAGVWTHLAGTYNGTTLSMYVNGDLIGSATAIGSLNDPVGADIEIGRNIANYYWNGFEAVFDGLIDEVSIYDRALNQTEIQAIVSARSNGKCRGDQLAPTWPVGSTLTGSNIAARKLTLTWSPAQDNVGITSYRIYQDGTLLATVVGTEMSYRVSKLNPSTSYSFKVEAGDAVGNWSTSGPSVNVTTPPAGKVK